MLNQVGGGLHLTTDGHAGIVTAWTGRASVGVVGMRSSLEQVQERSEVGGLRPSLLAEDPSLRNLSDQTRPPQPPLATGATTCPRVWTLHLPPATTT